MRTVMRIPLFIVQVTLLLSISCTSESELMIVNQPIDTNWQFSEAGKEKWLPASIPGTVHSDLYRNGLIPNPFYGCNEDSLQWIGQGNWVYRTDFEVSEILFAKQNIQLVFEGLDTYAKITLNGQLLGETDNMFRQWEYECKNMLKSGKNSLEIEFRSAELKTLADSMATKPVLPGGKRVFARKAGYHFGWDWGPTFITAGIWKPLYLKAWNDYRVLGVHIKNKSNTSKVAEIEAVFEIESSLNEKAYIWVHNSKSDQKIGETEITIEPGIKKYPFTFSIENPKLWWSNGLGEPYLYDLTFELVTASGLKYSKQQSHGIRTIEVVSEPDSIGQSMYLKLNGLPVFLKGANYIPQHSFVTEVREQNYHDIMALAKESNMNMLRVWGGGIYENDLFYDLCDQNGILVWQDFMFACAMYPGDSAFVENVRIEAEQQIRRLRNHASLALWCGNNEVDEGWHNWGWQKQFAMSEADSTSIWSGYKTVFREILPQLVQKQDSGRFYVSTSPLYGWGREKSMTHGSAHYWGVWWGLEPFTKYLEKVPRLMSEYGFQAMPAKSTIREIQPATDDSLFSPTLRCHQKHPTGYQTIAKYLEREHLFPKTVDDFIYASQLIQAEGIGMAIEAHRRAKPPCMGTLYWQLNDCWPVTSWSGTDFYGNRKMLQFKVKELYADIMVSLLNYRDSIEIYVVSDVLNDSKGRLEFSAIDFTGKQKSIHSEEITVPANQSRHVLSTSAKEIFATHNPETTLFEVRFVRDNGRTYQNRKFFAPFGLLQLPEAKIEVDSKPATDGYEIHLKANSLAAFVHLSLDEKHARFSDNHFTMLPGETRVVFVKCNLMEKEIKDNLEIISLRSIQH